MISAFNPKVGEWEIAWPGRVSRHDLVYLSPPLDPTQGIPLGNGDLGVLCWCEDSKIILAVNKCDLWDDADTGRFHNWADDEEEHSTCLRHACRIIIDFKMPVFDMFYLSDFTGRLDLAHASLTLTASGPFGSVSFEAFVSHDEGVLVCDIDADLHEDVPVEILLDRYGSRTYSHWYAKINRDPSIGLAGTEASADDSGVFISHELTSGQFAVGCRVAAGNVIPVYSKESSHCAKISLAGGCKKSVTLAAAVVSPEDADPIGRVSGKLEATISKWIDAIRATHETAWKSFWMRSLMESGDDYLDNLWHLTMYYANASQGGKYPGRFINGLWSWNRDVQHWNFYFHQNQQEIYWPLNAAGHHDLVESYLDLRFDGLPHAKEDAADLLGADGAYVSDVSERRGYNSVNEVDNHTPAAQIAMEFWRQYCFTGDMIFLRERALPYIVEAARFFESLFILGDDGYCHASEGAGFEGWIKMRDCITELSCAKVLFCTAVEACAIAGVNDPRIARWTEIADKLAPLPIVTADPKCFSNVDGELKYERGFFMGDGAASDKIFAAGISIDDGRVLTSRIPSDEETAAYPAYETIKMLEQNTSLGSGAEYGMKIYDGVFPTAEASVVYPSGLVGLSDKDTELYEAAVNTTKLYAPDCMGFDPLPIVLARLGLSLELQEILMQWPGRWQFYCNGFGHYGPMHIQKAESALRFRTTLVLDAATGEKFPSQSWPFRHMGMESMSVLATAMNESLLQSHDVVIRVAPAVSDTAQARFTLHAAGGFVVSSQIVNGKPMWIALKSLLGGVCRIENPWPVVYLYRNQTLESTYELEVVELSTDPGDLIMLAPEESVMDQWTTEPTICEPNVAPKVSSLGDANLGLPRMF
ncbi:MAG: glycosyl hydrolase family 95 catalytic domain-containing protein [Armatimonadota bacterium]